MSEIAIVQDLNSTYSHGEGMHLQLVPEAKSLVGEQEAEAPGRPPKLTAEEAVYLLERGPYVGRLRAQQVLLAFVRQTQLVEGHPGPTLPDYVELDISAAVTKCLKELKTFDKSRPLSVVAPAIPTAPLRASARPPLSVECAPAPKPAQAALPEQKVVIVTPPAPTPPKPIITVFPPVRRVELSSTPVTRMHPPASNRVRSITAPQNSKEDLSWQELALCAQTDTETFFPEKGGSTREAKKVCRECDVVEQCKQYALGNDERFGIWGGLSERERRKLKRKSP